MTPAILAWTAVISMLQLAAQPLPFKPTTIAAILSDSERYHGEWVTVHGAARLERERLLLVSGEQMIRVIADAALPEGELEASGQVLDVGRVLPGERRVRLAAGKVTLADLFPGGWPEPGREILLIATSLRRAAATSAKPTPALPLEVYFSTPVEGEADVRLGTPIRVQLSADLDARTLPGRVRVSYSASDSVNRGEPQPPAVEVVVGYNPATRAIEITPKQPLERFRPVVVELLEGIRGTDGSVLRPWVLRFTTGGS